MTASQLPKPPECSCEVCEDLRQLRAAEPTVPLTFTEEQHALGAAWSAFAHAISDGLDRAVQHLRDAARVDFSIPSESDRKDQP